MHPDEERAAMRQAGLVPIPLVIKPGMGCPGGIVERGPRTGATVPLCLTGSRLGGRDLTPAVRLVHGEAQCVDFHALSVGAAPERVHPAERGAPTSATACGGAQKAAVL